MARKRKNRLEVIHPDCAGIDIGKSKHYVAVGAHCSDDPVRHFGAFTDELEALAQWLCECGVRVVAMESTGVYWIPLYEVLDRVGFEVHLVNPRATKQVSGRKSDVLDCQWLQQLMSYGLLKGAFRPPDDVCVLRSYVRQRVRLGQDASRSVQHIQKAMSEMNVHLDSVLSDIMGKTGQQILRAIVNGERDGAVLAEYRDRRVKADVQTIARSLRGTWRDEHVFALTQALARYDFFQAQIQGCDERIAATLEMLSHDELRYQTPVTRSTARSAGERALQEALRNILGVDLTAIPSIGSETALTIAAEIGPDLSRFVSCEHFCSWLTLAPGTRISGDKALRGKPVKRVNRAGQALRMAATSARNSQSFIGAAHRARLSRLGTARANKATAHQLARLIYAMLTQGEEYVDRGMEHFEAQRRERQLRNLHRKARQLGFSVVADDQKSVA
jgi:transposase